MARQSTLNVSLTGTLRNYVRAKVRSGRYESASEVIRDGLRALQDQENAIAALWTDVRSKLAVARKQVAQGKTIDGEAEMNDILAELNADMPARKKAGKRTR